MDIIEQEKYLYEDADRDLYEDGNQDGDGDQDKDGDGNGDGDGNQDFNTLSNMIQTLMNNHFYNENTSDNDRSTYVYDAVHTLEKCDDVVFHVGQDIHICAYQVNIENDVPFLQYFMVKYMDHITFPTFKYKYLMTNEEIIHVCNTVLDMYRVSYHNVNHYVFGICKGYKIEDNNVYIFFDCSTYKIESHFLYKRNDLWLVLMDEIVNKQYVCDMKIKDSVVEFFTKNGEFNYLKNTNGNSYEMPVCVYSANYNHMIDFSLVFGACPQPLLDNYFIFTDYKNAFALAEDLRITKKEIPEYKTKKIQMGIIRFAIFASRHIQHLNRYEFQHFHQLQKQSPYQYYYNNEGESYWLIQEYNRQITLSAHHIKNITQKTLY